MGAPATTGASEQIVREHAALRRVALLIARQPSTAEVFAAVTEEAGRVLGAQTTNLMRVESPELAVIVAGWSEGVAHVPVGSTGLLDGRGLVGKILKTGRPSRVEDFDEVGGAVAAAMRTLGLRSGVAGPVIVRGRIWGALVACSTDPRPPPPGTEDRIAAFAQLVSVAIENAETLDELTASRARLVAAADEARRRIERDLHDGAQQRLVATALTLTLLSRRLEGAPRRGDRCSTARARSSIAASPSCATWRVACTPRCSRSAASCPPCARWSSARRCPSSCTPRCRAGCLRPSRPPAYFVVSEALTNVGKYALASAVTVRLELVADRLVVEIADDGVGGADATAGSGLSGLADRVEALRGGLRVASPPGGGTVITAELPCGPDEGPP